MLHNAGSHFMHERKRGRGHVKRGFCYERNIMLQEKADTRNTVGLRLCFNLEVFNS